MSAIPARDLRNHTAEILRRVEAGEEIEVAIAHRIPVVTQFSDYDGMPDPQIIKI